ASGSSAGDVRKKRKVVVECAAFCLIMRQLATYSRWSSHLLINSINDFISTQTVSSGRRIHYNDARFPPGSP
ncbi:hypothetical protein LUD45_24380, partial [Klebsiella pneumoniae]|nr:hypothetical protein [Klebsiella pneumoniae]